VAQASPKSRAYISEPAKNKALPKSSVAKTCVPNRPCAREPAEIETLQDHSVEVPEMHHKVECHIARVPIRKLPRKTARVPIMQSGPTTPRRTQRTNPGQNPPTSLDVPCRQASAASVT
jgi:hypothetical protein